MNIQRDIRNFNNSVANSIYCLLVEDSGFKELEKYKEWYLNMVNYTAHTTDRTPTIKGIIKIISALRDKMAASVSNDRNKYVGLSEDRLVIAELAVKYLDSAEEALYSLQP